MSIIKLGLCGANGKMGHAILESIKQKSDKFICTAKLTSAHTESELAEFCHKSDIIIDFSSPNSLKTLTKAAMASKTRLVVGTSGLHAEHFSYLKELAKHVAVIHAANTSIGANLVAMLAAKSAKILQGYDIEIIEAHHRHKKDAPSGTALMFGQKIAEELGIDFAKNATFDGAKRGQRKDGEIGFSSIRGGGIIGDNEVLFAGENEIVTIACKAISRKAFADGALFIANWLSDKKAGFYSMEDVL
jgi:4-hydroxy-tetrahydrodipicolinate reductase